MRSDAPFLEARPCPSTPEAQLAKQPRLCQPPRSLDGRRRSPQCRSRLLDRHSGEETHLDNPSVFGIPCGEPLERAVDRQHVGDGTVAGRDVGDEGRDMVVVAPPRLSADRARA